MMLELPGIVRISFVDWLRGTSIPTDRSWWLDQILYDIPATVEMAVLQMANRGAGAVTLYDRLLWNSKSYGKTLDICVNHKLVVVAANEQCERYVYADHNWITSDQLKEMS